MSRRQIELKICATEVFLFVSTTVHRRAARPSSNLSGCSLYPTILIPTLNFQPPLPPLRTRFHVIFAPVRRAFRRLVSSLTPFRTSKSRRILIRVKLMRYVTVTVINHSDKNTIIRFRTPIIDFTVDEWCYFTLVAIIVKSQCLESHSDLS